MRSNNVKATIEKISLAFSQEIRNTADAEELAAIIYANFHEDYGVCATHHFMDASMAMAAAWRTVYGTDFIPKDREPTRLASDLWCEAWVMSVNARFLNGIDMEQLDDLFEEWAEAEGFAGLLSKEVLAQDLSEEQAFFLNVWEAKYNELNRPQEHSA